MEKEEALRAVKPDVKDSDVVYDCPATLHYRKVAQTPEGSVDEAVGGHILLTSRDLYFVKDAEGLLSKPRVFTSFSIAKIGSVKADNAAKKLTVVTPNDRGYSLGFVINRFKYEFDTEDPKTLKEQLDLFLKGLKKPKK